jgi:hypothetical protein
MRKNKVTLKQLDEQTYMMQYNNKIQDTISKGKDKLTESRGSNDTVIYPEVQVLGRTLISVGEAVANKAHTIPHRI